MFEAIHYTTNSTHTLVSMSEIIDKYLNLIKVWFSFLNQILSRSKLRNETWNIIETVVTFPIVLSFAQANLATSLSSSPHKELRRLQV